MSTSSRVYRLLYLLSAVLLAFQFAQPLQAADNNEQSAAPSGDERVVTPRPQPPAVPARPERQLESRHYLTDGPEPRSDAGVFHVGFAVGGNFYIEPELDDNGDVIGSFKDFGYQGGAYFDYDYSEATENIPLMLRGMVGYKYVLDSTNVFTFDGVVRRQFRFSEKASFGIGVGASAAIWYRSESTTEPVAQEEVIFLPSLLASFGFEFDPFMADFKWLINRIGQDSTIMGWELYFGFRL